MPTNQINTNEARKPLTVAKVQNFLNTDVTILDNLMHFALSVPDFRRSCKGNLRHKLADIILLMIFARVSGHATRAAMIEFGKQNLNKLRKLGFLENGVPSEATICRVENGINDAEMADKMRLFIQQFQDKLLKDSRVREIICVDGKAMRGTIQANGRNPDIVSAYSYNTGLILATELCHEKSNEIKAVPKLSYKIDLHKKILTADAMSLQKVIIDIIRKKGGDFLIELKANQRALRYSVEDCLRGRPPLYVYTKETELSHGRIEQRTYRIYDGLDIIADKEKWGGNMTIIEYESRTIKKSTGAETSEKRLYVTSLPTDTPNIGDIIRSHWSIESMHWGLDYNLQQDKIKRKTATSARNLDTIQRIVYSIFSIWKGLRKKRSDKKKGIAHLMRYISMSFTNLMRFLSQK